MSSGSSSISHAPSFAQALVAGGLAGTSVDVALFPLDTLKTRLQSATGFVKAGGFSGIYRGLGSVTVGSAPGAAFFFTSYERGKAIIPRAAPNLSAPVVHMLAASIGEVTACLIRVPTEVVKSRSQAAVYGSSSGSRYAAARVWSETGLRGFYQGFGSTIAREIPFTCIQFPLYEQFKHIVATRALLLRSKEEIPARYAAICGSAAGAIAAAATTPLDVAKTRIMLSTRSKVAITEAYSPNFVKTMSRIVREEGTSALFKGIAPRVMWISVGGAIFLGVYERVRQTLVSNGILV